MSYKKGLTLLEITVVMMIIGVLVAVAIPNYLTFIQKGAAKAAQNNLIIIYNAEKNYYFANGVYCISSTNPNPCDSLPDINNHLATAPSTSLNITDSNFIYQCGADASGFSCTAINNSDDTLQLTIKNTPLVLPGGTPPLNPSCTDTIASNCPTS